MWEITNSGQLLELLQAAGMGVLLGLYYDVYRVIRIVMRPSARVIFIQDVAFFSTASLLTFLFLLTINGGQLRVYLLLGILTGFVIYYVTIGRLVVRFADVVTKAIAFLWGAFWRAVSWPFRRIGRLLGRPIRKLLSAGKKMSEKFWKFLKKRLKPEHNLLYNEKNETGVSFEESVPARNRKRSAHRRRREEENESRTGVDTESSRSTRKIRRGRTHEGRAEDEKKEKEHFSSSGPSGFFGLRNRHAGAAADGARQPRKGRTDD